MSFFLIYILGLLICSTTFFILNKEFFWITQDNDIDYPALIGGIIIWPVALLILIIFGVGRMLYSFLPKNNKPHKDI